MTSYTGTMLLTSQDSQLIATVANRIIEITPKGLMDKIMGYDEFIENDEIQKELELMYK